MASMKKTDISEINQFLRCATPEAWIVAAVLPENRSTLLIDHANCEKKAASTALHLMFRYTDNADLLHKMSRLAREELRHFEQVLSIIQKQKIDYVPLSASRYAEGLRKHVRNYEPQKLADILIVGAIIEARSCERFASLAPHLETELSDFYTSLLKSEARHFKDYLKLARATGVADVDSRIDHFLTIESALINDLDTELRFHSGCPMSNVNAWAAT